MRGSQLKDLISAYDDKEKEQKGQRAFVRLVYQLGNESVIQLTSAITSAGADRLVDCESVSVSSLEVEILQVLDGTTGLNMSPQAREFSDVVGVTGLILTKLDGSARGGCVISVVDELGIPLKFVGVGEGVEDLQPFDAEAFVDAIFT
ncbi:hypothetical protein K1719_002995 [Acacia pycnantha]|nr:hypothetical protein K1719_002995 [Acacia pycnantha]